MRDLGNQHGNVILVKSFAIKCEKIMSVFQPEMNSVKDDDDIIIILNQTSINVFKHQEIAISTNDRDTL